jgi:hypothetical protein
MTDVTEKRFLDEGVDDVKLTPLTMKYLRETVERHVRSGADIEKIAARITTYGIKVWEEEAS